MLYFLSRESVSYYYGNGSFFERRLIKIASWNVNSIRARNEHVVPWLRDHEADVFLMQELKGTDSPAELFQGLGYETVVVSHKTYNGVAILSRHPIETIRKTLAPEV